MLWGGCVAPLARGAARAPAGLRLPAWARPRGGLPTRGAGALAGASAAGRRVLSGAAGEGASDEPPHVVLGLSPRFNAESLKRAFRVLAHRHHPDKGGSAREFRRIRRAYEALSSAAQVDVAREAEAVEELTAAVLAGDAARGWAALRRLVDERSGAEYDAWFRLFLQLVEMSADRRCAMPWIDEMAAAGLLPGELHCAAFNDLLDGLARYEPTVDVAMEVLAVMDRLRLQPDQAVLHRVFSYKRGLG
jgi:hypothetical protein